MEPIDRTDRMDPNPILEFICADCRSTVFGLSVPASPIRCATCAWINDYVPLADQPAVRERLGVPLRAE